MPAGSGPPTPAASGKRARKPQASAQTAQNAISDRHQPPAASAGASAAGTAMQPKHKKRRKSGEQASAQIPAQQADAGPDGAADGLQPVTAGNAIRSAADATPADDAAVLDPLSPAVLRAHAAFFDHLVELVPPRHYHDLDADRVSTKYMKKADRDAAKAAFRKQHKQNKRDKLDPDKAQTALDVQRQLAQQQAQDRVGGGGGGGDDAAADAAAPDADTGDAAGGGRGPGLRLNLTDSAPREELQQRLAAKVAALREARHAEERARKTEAAKRFRATNGRVEKKVGAKRKRGADTAQGGGPGSPKTPRLSTDDFQKQLAEVGEVLSSGRKPAAKRPPQASLSSDLAFGRLDVGKSTTTVADLKPGKKRRKDSKAALLAKAEAKQKTAAVAAIDAAAEAKAAGEAWGAALARARGEKVLDDPTRLRRSLKKDAKAAAKRGAAWAQRISAQQQSQAERQKKRTDNLQARVTAKADKKKAKREKKLLRPGFEGRRSGFIPSPGGGGGGGSGK